MINLEPDTDEDIVLEEAASASGGAASRRLVSTASLRAGVPSPWNDLKYVKSTIGRRVRLFWGGNRKWFKGVIASINEAGEVYKYKK